MCCLLRDSFDGLKNTMKVGVVVVVEGGGNEPQLRAENKKAINVGYQFENSVVGMQEPMLQNHICVCL